MAVEFGVLIPTREAVMSSRPEAAPLLAMAERAEAAGFDSVWIGDSLTARPRHEPLTLMAVIAGRTRRVKLGTGVLLPALRNPVVLAHIVGTLDRAAVGRVILGMGFAGDNPPIRKEFAAAGVPFDRRVGRFLETIEICQALWRRDHVSFAGKHFTLDDVTMEPKPHRPGGPPIWIGGSGPTALRIASRFDAWFPTGPSVEFFAQHFPSVQAAARAAGRPAGAVAGAAYVTLALDANRAAAEQRLASFLETYYAAPAKTIMARQATYAGPIEGCVEWFQRWIDAGAVHFALRFAGGDQLAQVDEALTRVATAETEERLLAVGRAGTADHVERIVRGWRRMDRKAEAAETSRRHAGRALHVYQDEDGMVMVRGRLAPEAGALLVQALAAARETLYQRTRAQNGFGESQDVPAETPTMAQQQADSLVLVAETALRRGIDPGAPAERYQVVIHVDAPVLADPEAPGQSVLEDGTHVSAETSRRLACDATRVVMRHDVDGRVVEVGARTRTIPPAFRRALLHRDHGCRFPGCGVRVGQAHHIRHWAQGGPTKLSNLALLCRRHRRAVHEEGYQVERQLDGAPQFRWPDGRIILDVPLPPAVPTDPVAVMRAQHEQNGLTLHPQTAIPDWRGEPFNLGYAIDVLHPRARRMQ